jgi:hypothetical protein
MATMKRTRAPKKKARRGSAETVVRRSVSLDPALDKLAHDLVGDTNFSAFVNEAVRQRVQRMQMLKLLGDLDREFGPVGEKEQKKAEELWQTASRSTRAR